MSRTPYISAALATAMILAACSGPKDGAESGANNAAAATENESTATAAPPALSGEAGFALAADCAAKLKSVSSLYDVLAKQSSGPEAEELAQRATQRASAATAFLGIAEQVGGTLGKTPEQIAQANRDAEAAVKAEFEKRPFEEFAGWVTGEVDTKCRAALASQG